MRRAGIVVALLIALPSLAGAQTQPVGAIAALVGEGTITHAVRAERAPAKVRDEVYVRDRIETAQRSVIRVLMGGRVTITIRERSIVTITDDPMRTRVDLESGTLAFKVHEGGLRAGEVAELLTPNTVTGIRGSLVIAEVSGTDSDVTVLEAHRPITIAPRSNPTQTMQLPVGHTVRVSGPRQAPRFGQIRRALRERLAYVADLAEVPGRPRDGGQERAFTHDARAAHVAPQVGAHPSARAEILQRQRSALVERRGDPAASRRRARPEDPDDAVRRARPDDRDDAVDRSGGTRRFGARR
ncbi:MAG TPA: FecR domain-containing protein [Methylomirabilota bacterium]